MRKVKRPRKEINEFIVRTWLKLIRLCRLEITYGVYLPKRRAVANHEKPIPTLGIGSKISICNYEYHHLYIDFDNPNIYKNIKEFALAHFRDKFFIIRKTRKGYHLLVFYPFTRKEVDSYIVKIKDFVDPKWLTLQRHRGFYVIRVAGKYPKPDIETVYLHPPVDENGEVIEHRLRYGAFWHMYVELLKETKPETWSKYLGAPGLAHH